MSLGLSICLLRPRLDKPVIPVVCPIDYAMLWEELKTKNALSTTPITWPPNDMGF